MYYTNHEPEAVEQPRELQNDDSLSLVASRGEKRETLHSPLGNLPQSAKSAKCLM